MWHGLVPRSMHSVFTSALIMSLMAKKDLRIWRATPRIRSTFMESQNSGENISFKRLAPVGLSREWQAYLERRAPAHNRADIGFRVPDEGASPKEFEFRKYETQSLSEGMSPPLAGGLKDLLE